MTRSIGSRCTCSNAFSRAVLIALAALLIRSVRQFPHRPLLVGSPTHSPQVPHPLFDEVATAGRSHLFPCRTQPLSSPAPMVLPHRRKSRSPPHLLLPIPHPQGSVDNRQQSLFLWSSEWSASQIYLKSPYSFKPNNSIY